MIYLPYKQPMHFRWGKLRNPRIFTRLESEKEATIVNDYDFELRDAICLWNTEIPSNEDTSMMLVTHPLGQVNFRGQTVYEFDLIGVGNFSGWETETRWNALPAQAGGTSGVDFGRLGSLLTGRSDGNPGEPEPHL